MGRTFKLLEEYKTKPTTVKAIRYTVVNFEQVKQAVGSGFVAFMGDQLCVIGKQGAVPVNPGDYIIMEPDGEGAYPCNPEVFDSKYEKVE